MAAETTPTTSNMLLRLPGELRNRIFRLALLQTDSVDLLRLQWTKDRTGYDPTLIPEPPLSRACKALRQEVLSIYYGENTFNFGTGCHFLSMLEIPPLLERWIRRLGDNGRFLTSMDVNCNCEILGPKNQAFFYRDFWEILQFSVQSKTDARVTFSLRGDPSFDKLCTCDIDAANMAGALWQASRLYFRTTELVECERCCLPRLSEVRNVKNDLIVL